MKDKPFKIIPKGTELQRWKPHKIISLIDSEREKSFDDLPGYLPCPVLDHSVDLKRMDGLSPEFKKFVNRLFRDGSFEALCILAVFDEVLSCKNFSSLENLHRQSSDGSFSSSPMEDVSLLVESWPLIQNKVSFQHFLNLYRRVELNLHMLTLDHPLGHYAKKGLFQIDNLNKAVQLALRKKWIPKESENRLQISQFLLDYVASLPPRIVGVLIVDPIFASEPKALKQSNIPSSYLELTLDRDDSQMMCKMVSMYDMQSDEPLTVSTRPVERGCKENQYDENMQIESTDDALMAQRLAHTYFQNEKHAEASLLYGKCYEFFTQKEKDDTKASDLLHAMAAVLLTNLKFLQAQREWRKGSKYQHLHSGISLQLEKQAAYGYFDSAKVVIPVPMDLPKYEAIGSSRKLFVTPNAVLPETCRQLIEWAKDRAFKREGWTTSRHYAVPTNDIPIHASPELLSWFVEWFRGTAVPLLQSQFQTDQNFFVHDAFLVRYSAGSSSDYLPLHYDESTHSFILALNSEFEGGGTYFHSLDHTLVPCCGSLVSFRGNQLLHGGNVVTKGERFILAAFLYVDDEAKVESKRSSQAISFSKTVKRSKPDESFSFGFF